MRFDVLTLFPDLFAGYLTQSILHKALECRLVEIHLWNLRDWAQGKHKQRRRSAAWRWPWNGAHARAQVFRRRGGRAMPPPPSRGRLSCLPRQASA